MERLYRDFETIKKNGLVCDGVVKRFAGECTLPLSLMPDAFGFYYNGDKKRWVLFVTDSERGFVRRRAFCDKKEGLERTFMDFDARERYIMFHADAGDDPEAYRDVLKEWLFGYDYTDIQTERTITYLMQDGRVFFDAVYRAVTGEAMPERFAAAPSGKSVGILCRDYGMILPAAFCYQVYLGKNPEEALKNLERGLPRK